MQQNHLYGVYLYINGAFKKQDITLRQLQYSSTTISLNYAWTCMVPHNITGGFFWQPFVFHVYFLCMNGEPWNCVLIRIIYFLCKHKSQQCFCSSCSHLDPSNHTALLVTIAFNIFSRVEYFLWNLCLLRIIKHGSMLNHAWCFAWGSMRVWSYSRAVP